MQDNAKLTVQQLAAMLDLSEEAVEAGDPASLRRMASSRGYRALVNWERTDVHRASALIELRVTPKKDTGFDAIAARVKGAAGGQKAFT